MGNNLLFTHGKIRISWKNVPSDQFGIFKCLILSKTQDILKKDRGKTENIHISEAGTRNVLTFLT